MHNTRSDLAKREVELTSFLPSRRSGLRWGLALRLHQRGDCGIYAGVVLYLQPRADVDDHGSNLVDDQLAALAAGRLVLRELDRLAAARLDFAFESTLSGTTYLGRLRRWKFAGYRVEIVFLKVHSVQLALRRIAARVRQGGHDVPRDDVLRRFDRGWANFQSVYRSLSDAWTVYDNSGDAPLLLERGP